MSSSPIFQEVFGRTLFRSCAGIAVMRVYVWIASAVVSGALALCGRWPSTDELGHAQTRMRLCDVTLGGTMTERQAAGRG